MQNAIACKIAGGQTLRASEGSSYIFHHHIVRRRGWLVKHLVLDLDLEATGPALNGLNHTYFPEFSLVWRLALPNVSKLTISPDIIDLLLVVLEARERGNNALPLAETFIDLVRPLTSLTLGEDFSIDELFTFVTLCPNLSTLEYDGSAKPSESAGHAEPSRHPPDINHQLGGSHFQRRLAQLVAVHPCCRGHSRLAERGRLDLPHDNGGQRRGTTSPRTEHKQPCHTFTTSVPAPHQTRDPRRDHLVATDRLRSAGIRCPAPPHSQPLQCFAHHYHPR